MELDSTKIIKNNKQIKLVKEVVSKYPYDLLSVNEIQYDKPGVPNSSYKTDGQNLEKLNKLINPSHEHNFFYSFSSALTGENAQRNERGEFYSNPKLPEARKLADVVNFGIFPSQYSNGIASRYKIISITRFNPQWKKFNNSVKPSLYTDARKNPLPEDMKLFDKSFTDTIVEIEGQRVHILGLHTVPAFGFGNPNTPNLQRNADQLRFLEYYILGSTSYSVPKSTPKLSRDSKIIAMGDWNVDIKDSSKEGSSVLKRIFTHLTHADSYDTPTHLGIGAFKKPHNPMLLDYIAYSSHFEKVRGKVIYPKSGQKLIKCENNLKERKTKNFVFLKKSECLYRFNRNYFNIREASDHLPIYLELKFK